MISQLLAQLPPDLATPLASLHATAQLLNCGDDRAWGTVARPDPKALAAQIFLSHEALVTAIAARFAPEG